MSGRGRKPRRMHLELRQRRLPGGACRFLEQKRLIGWHAQPGIALDFLFQLAGRPAGIAKRQQALARPTAACNRAQDINARGQGEAFAKGQASLGGPIIRMQHKAAPSFHRPARDKADLPLRRHGLQAKLLQQFVEAETFNRAIHHQPHRALSRMVAQTHHALRKARVFHAGHRNQQMPGQIIASPAGGGFALSGHG